MIKTPRQTDMPCVTSDYFPTVVEALGAPNKFDRPMDGISLMPLIRGAQSIRNSPIYFQSKNMATVNDDRYKLILNKKETELYDLITDPRETRNLAESKPEVAAKMLQQLKVWQESCKNSDAGNDYQKNDNDQFGRDPQYRSRRLSLFPR